MLTFGDQLLDWPLLLTVLLIASSSSSSSSSAENRGDGLALRDSAIRRQNLRVDHIDSQLNLLDQEVAKLGLPFDKFALTSTFVRIINLEGRRVLVSGLRVCGRSRMMTTCFKPKHFTGVTSASVCFDVLFWNVYAITRH